MSLVVYLPFQMAACPLFSLRSYLTTALDALKFCKLHSYEREGLFRKSAGKPKNIGQSYDVLMSTSTMYMHAHFTRCYVCVDPVSRKHVYVSNHRSIC